MQNCSKSFENYCIKHENLVGFRGLCPPNPSLGTVPLDLRRLRPRPCYRLALPRSPCVCIVKKILRIGPGSSYSQTWLWVHFSWPNLTQTHHSGNPTNPSMKKTLSRSDTAN